MSTETELTAGPRRLHHAFADRKGRAALMPYLMAGFPSLEGSLDVGRAYAKYADLVEVGVPFSDPLADGPVIQAAGQRALEAGSSLEAVLERVTRPLAEHFPVVLMCYMNQIVAHGLEAAPFAMLRHGVSGLIAENARGFVYVVSVTGVTGERSELPPELRSVVENVRDAALVPAAVGFGIGTPAQAAAVAEIADGVIIGSRLVREVADAPSLEQGLEGIDRFLHETSEALRR